MIAHLMERMLRPSVEDRVERWAWRRYSKRAPRGSGYCEDQGERYLLIRRWKLHGITVWRREVDCEEIPAHVWIHASIGGYYGEWKSKFQHIIDRQRKP